jgi:hypothetical protein
MELKLYFTKEQMEEYIKKNGYEIRFSYIGNSDVKGKKIFFKNKEIKEKTEDIFRKLVHKKLLSR